MIVDVLSFSTSVAVAVARGAAVWPHSGHERAEELARAIGATLVRGRNMREGRTHVAGEPARASKTTSG